MIKVAQIFGADSKIDAYYYVLGIYLFLILILQNVLKTVLMPILIDEQKNNSKNIIEFYNGLLSYSFLFLLVITLISIFIIQSDLFVYLLPINSPLLLYRQFFLLGLPLVFLNIIYSIFSLIYNSYQKFGVLEFLLNLRIPIAFIILIVLHKKLDTISLMIGNLVGQLIVVASAFYFLSSKNILNFKFNFQLSNSLKYVFKFSVIPLLAGVFNAMQPLISNFFLANYSSQGSITMLSYIQKISSIPTILFTSSFMTVFLSHISKLELDNNKVEIKKSITKSISSIGTLVLPVILYLFIIRQDLVNFFFKDSKLTAENLHVITSGLLLFLVSFYFSQIYSLLFRIFIAKKLLNMVLLINFISFFIHLLLTVLFVKIFKMDLLGTIISILSSNVLIVLISFVYINLKFNVLDLNYLYFNFIKTFISLVITFLIMTPLYSFISSIFIHFLIINLILFSILFFIFNFFIQYIVRNQDVLTFRDKIFSLINNRF